MCFNPQSTFYHNDVFAVTFIHISFQNTLECYKYVNKTTNKDADIEDLIK